MSCSKVYKGQQRTVKVEDSAVTMVMETKLDTGNTNGGKAMDKWVKYTLLHMDYHKQEGKQKISLSTRSKKNRTCEIISKSFKHI